jgi:protein-S-isoprenylcysteine O-methyltransferase Ste14
VVTSGPYRYVRHPGYAVVIVGVVCSGLTLGSWLAMIPMMALVGGILVRVVVEDQFLAEHLEGYVEYMDRVSFRLLPHVW